MATNQPSSSALPKAQEFPVRVPKNCKKSYSLLKFHGSNIVDFTKCGKAKIERENNLREYKLSNDMDQMPKFGAGSEYGRDMREEARRKKYGIYRKRYVPEDQPWILKVGESKQPVKKFRGVREGGVTDHSSYFVFTQCPDGAFEAQPVEEWYNFTTVDKFKTLSVEEAEERFERRDKTHNFWSIMAQKKVKNEDNKDEDLDDEDGKGKKKYTKKGKKRDSLVLTELDEWGGMSDDGDDDDDDDDSDKPADKDDGERKKKPKKKGKAKQKSKTSHKTNSDDEALEESDSVDEGHEVDYMTDSDSEDDDMYVDKKRQDTDKYKETGVEDQIGLRGLIESDEDEEEEKKDEENEANDEADEGGPSKDKKKGSDSDSSSSSDSESDPEKETDLSALLLVRKKDRKDKEEREKKKAPARRDSAESDRSSDKASRSATPTVQLDKGIKRKTDSPVPKSSKKSKVDAAAPINPIATSEGITEEAVRKYLMRKPMTTKDLVQKFKNTSLSKDQLVSTVAALLKRIGPEKTTIKDKLYLSLK